MSVTPSNIFKDVSTIREENAPQLLSHRLVQSLIVVAQENLSQIPSVPVTNETTPEFSNNAVIIKRLNQMQAQHEE